MCGFLRSVVSEETVWAGLIFPVSYTHLDVYKRQRLHRKGIGLLHVKVIAARGQHTKGQAHQLSLIHILDHLV